MPIKRIAAGLTLLVLLSGCSGDSYLWPRAQAEKQRLTVALWDYDRTSYDRHLVEAFEQKYPSVEVQVISYSDAYYDERLESLLTSEEEVDVMFCRTMTTLGQLCDSGQALPLDGLMRQNGVQPSEYPYIEAFRQDGVQYAIPYRMDRYVLIYNCDLFDQAGLPYPDAQMTWEEYQQTALALQERLDKPDTYAAMTLPMEIQWIAAGRTQAFRYLDGDLEHLRPILELMLQMQSEDGTTPFYGDCLAQNIQQRQFETGRYGMYVGGTWYLNYLASNFKDGLFNFRWGATLQPIWEGMDASQCAVVPTSVCINSSSRKTELAWEFVRFVTGKEGARIMAEEQMMPAYMDEEIEEIYRTHFMGAALDDALLQTRTGVCGGIPSRGEQRMAGAICSGFSRILTGENSIDEEFAALKQQQAAYRADSKEAARTNAN
ncbi:ABC transporter substrate-binding protein [Butyricicoccus sp. Marseille-Q5471]|uniref:ABC transporter substrate-binding protein n=1 Tax=Butyricicoccus sp. Marseille-Q5471 TaxID=3039493 RepID=UPI0024BC9A2E|nr:extracellular solute-binding protein [Butyricicoccus sp. Marseille-Q5471]